MFDIGFLFEDDEMARLVKETLLRLAGGGFSHLERVQIPTIKLFLEGHWGFHIFCVSRKRYFLNFLIFVWVSFGSTKWPLRLETILYRWEFSLPR